MWCGHYHYLFNLGSRLSGFEHPLDGDASEEGRGQAFGAAVCVLNAWVLSGVATREVTRMLLRVTEIMRKARMSSPDEEQNI